jgi:hypothetical protein
MKKKIFGGGALLAAVSGLLSAGLFLLQGSAPAARAQNPQTIATQQAKPLMKAVVIHAYGGPLVVRREVCVPGENLAAVKGFLRQFPTRESVSVMPARHALPRAWRSCDRKRHRRIRTADSKSEIRLTLEQRPSRKPKLNITLHEDAKAGGIWAGSQPLNPKGEQSGLPTRIGTENVL